MSKIGRSIEIENRLVVPLAKRKGDMENDH
jgi:hypothetical protein